MTSKIRIKMGPIEVEYEGSEEFLKKELPDLLAAVSKLYHESGGNVAAGDESARTDAQNNGKATPATGTTATISARLAVKSGPELILAAAARLTFGLSKDSFSRKELLAEIQTAKQYYKKSYSANLSTYLGQLVKSDLREVSKDQYALSAKKADELRKNLAS